MAWTEETKTQAPHWKHLDITDRNISRKDIEDKSTTSRDSMTKYIYPNNLDHKTITRRDIENKYGSKATSSWTEETKGSATWSEN